MSDKPAEDAKAKPETPPKRTKKHKKKSDGSSSRETPQVRPRALTSALALPALLADAEPEPKPQPSPPKQSSPRSRIEQLPNHRVPGPDSSILIMQATLPGAKNVSGHAIITHSAIWFHSKQMRCNLIRIRWRFVREISDPQKKGLEKAVYIGVGNEHIIFNALKDRDTFLFLARLEFALARAKVQTYGFLRKGDEEVATRITPLKAPHVIEDSVTMGLKEVVSKLREGALTTEMLTVCGLTNVAPLKWTKTKTGIQRIVSYTHPMSQVTDVACVQTLMKSGSVCVLETTSKFSRPAHGNFLTSNVQFYFKEDDGVVNMRGAYALTWDTETWDKEFVEAAVSRVNRMSFYFLKRKFSGENFNVAKYEGKWRMHQPYVLVIATLTIVILCVLILPVDTDWARFIAGVCVFAFLF